MSNIIKYPYLNDKAFLEEFDQLRIKEQFVKITILTLDEKPLQEIQGRVTTGNINIDGKSSVRRTCNLTFLADEYENDLTNIQHILSLNKKVKLEIGFTNTTSYYKDYKKLWFPLGVYVIINPSISNSSGGVTISLQLKDKMCLLNGECGGIIPASTVFDEYETVDGSGTTVILRPTIYQIITELVNHFGGEQLGKILISDLDTRVKKVMKWTGNTPLYLISSNIGNFRKFTTKLDEVERYLRENSEKEEKYSYISFSTGEDVGYIYTDFVYPSELIGDAGTSVCNILDTIKETLGNYEYFYDLEGNFRFQEVKNYLNTSESTSIINQLNKTTEPYKMDLTRGTTSYKFNSNNIVTSYSNTPQYNMIKNDFVVWGKRVDSNDNEYPIRYHLSIDAKPKTGNFYENVYFYIDPETKVEKAQCPIKLPSLENIKGEEGFFYSYDDKIYYWDIKKQDFKEMDNSNTYRIKTTDWRSDLYLSGAAAAPRGIDSNYYYTELLNEWTRLYNLKAKFVEDKDGGYYEGAFYEDTLKKPTILNYWLDFIDSAASISNISISNIGRRTKVLNDDKINCLFETDIPDFVLIEKDTKDTGILRKECIVKGQDFIQVDKAVYGSLAIGGYLNSAFYAIRDLLYQYTSFNETISINCLPIYYLEPNTRIYVSDKRSGIDGEYVISSMSLPLDTTGTMTISANKVLDKI